MRSKVTVFLSVLALAALASAGKADPSASFNPVEQLGIWVGHWTFSGQIYETKYSHAHADTGVADCGWSANKGYVICDYYSDDPPHDDLSVMNYRSSAKSYMLALVHQDRPAHSETLTRNGNTWISVSDVSNKGKALVLRTRFVFLTPDKQTTTVQVSADGGQTWTTTIHVTALKAA